MGGGCNTGHSRDAYDNTKAKKYIIFFMKLLLHKFDSRIPKD